jgi:hypothetical protein
VPFDASPCPFDPLLRARRKTVGHGWGPLVLTKG